jgi:hypothetical protein
MDHREVAVARPTPWRQTIQQRMEVAPVSLDVARCVDLLAGVRLEDLEEPVAVLVLPPQRAGDVDPLAGRLLDDPADEPGGRVLAAVELPSKAAGVGVDPGGATPLWVLCEPALHILPQGSTELARSDGEAHHGPVRDEPGFDQTDDHAPRPPSFTLGLLDLLALLGRTTRSSASSRGQIFEVVTTSPPGVR